MLYKIVWENKADDDLIEISPDIASKIYKKVETYLTQAPKELGKPLTGNHSGLYRYRYGDYRIIYKILEEERNIVILRIGHRKEVY